MKNYFKTDYSFALAFICLCALLLFTCVGCAEKVWYCYDIGDEIPPGIKCELKEAVHSYDQN